MKIGGVQVKINVNAIEKHIETETVSYEDIVKLAGKDPNRFYTVTYSQRQSSTRGLLYKGKGTTAIEGMVFSVSDTSNA